MGIREQFDDCARGQAVPLPSSGTPLFRGSVEPRFLVTIDTEEAFDWDGPFRRDGHSVAHIPALERFQACAERFGVKPVYLVDYPVATDPAARDFFGALLTERLAYVGAHLHPWNTPPLDEVLSAHNSYGCNLDPALERAKLEILLEAIASLNGSLPMIFRAGRYGAGQQTLDLLDQLGIGIDSSTRPLFDYRRDGGPDYSGHASEPYWLREGRVAELPVTSVFTGILHALGENLYGTDSHPSRLRGAMSRLKLLSRTPLTPEGIDLAEAMRGVDRALSAKLPMLVFSFHSPSVVPGNTGYVRNDADADLFHQWWHGMFEHLAVRSVAPADLAALHDEIFAGRRGYAKWSGRPGHI